MYEISRGLDMKSKTIMFDIDGVLADFVWSFTTEAHKLDPSVVVIPTTQQHSWNMKNIMDSKLVNKVWRVIEKEHMWWIGIPPCVPDVVFDSIHKLKITNDVVFCTGRDSRGTHSVTYQTGLWLTNHAVGIPTNVIASKCKGEIARALGVNYAIDDRASNAAMVHWLTNGECRSYIIDRPYNANADLPEKVRRVGTVEEFLDDIKKGK